MAGLSLRLPDELEIRLAQEARHQGLPRSEVARAAIEDFLDRRERDRYLAAFVKEARAAYGNPAIIQEAKDIAAEALLLDNEALDHAENRSRVTAKPLRNRNRKRRR